MFKDFSLLQNGTKERYVGERVREKERVKAVGVASTKERYKHFLQGSMGDSKHIDNR